MIVMLQACSSMISYSGSMMQASACLTQDKWTTPDEAQTLNLKTHVCTCVRMRLQMQIKDKIRNMKKAGRIPEIPLAR